MVISQRPMLFTRKIHEHSLVKDIANGRSGCEPLTPEDIAEVVVFAAGRRENVVLADSLIFPNHQVCLCLSFCFELTDSAGCCYRHAQEVVMEWH